MKKKYCYHCMELLTAEGTCSKCKNSITEEKNLSYALPKGTVLRDRYLVGRVLGQGGFGITYIGFDTALEIKVAIKEYFCINQTTRNNAVSPTIQWNAYASDTVDGRAIFLKEARKMAKIQNVAEVARILDTFNENNTAYIVMEYVEGVTLADKLLEMQRPLTWKEARPLFFPVLSAMHKVHERGLIHRDLSPDNLMISANGIRILDLGAAKDLKTDSGYSSVIVAKSGFSPIEQYGSHGTTDARTDVYSICATIYYALTGVVPPQATNRLESDTLNLEKLAQNGVPHHVINAIASGMAIMKGNRLDSMQALFKMLIEDREPPQASSTPAPSHQNVPVKKNKTSQSLATSKKKTRKKGKLWQNFSSAVTIIIVVCIMIFVIYTIGNIIKSVRLYISDNVDDPSAPSADKDAGQEAADQKDDIEYATLDVNIFNNAEMGSHAITICFLDTLDGVSLDAMDYSAKQDKSVLAWMADDTLYIGGDGQIVLLNGLVFANYSFIQNIYFAGNVDTSHVTDTSYMFADCSHLTTLDLNGFDTSNVTNMDYMFYGCSSLSALDLSGFDMSKVISSQDMLTGCNVDGIYPIE